jgi:hypothetical protein
MRGVKEQPLSIEALARNGREGPPALTHPRPDQLEPPQQRDRIVQVARDRGGGTLEGRARHPAGPRVVATREVHEREVPEEVIAEPAQVVQGWMAGGSNEMPAGAAPISYTVCARAWTDHASRGLRVTATSAVAKASGRRWDSSRAKACRPSMKEFPG